MTDGHRFERHWRRIGIGVFASFAGLMLSGQAPVGMGDLLMADELPVRARLVTGARTIVPGGSVTVGVLLTVAEGWHVYWRHPGDAGLATSVAFVVPEGFKVGPLQWPIPRRFNEPGDIATIGYADEVLLFAEVTAPEEMAAGSKVEVGVAAEWLMCRDVCMPGSAEMKTVLTAAAAAEPAEDELIAQWRARLPESPRAVGGRDSSVRRVTVESEELESGDVKVDVRVWWREPVDRVEWMLAPPNEIEVIDVVQLSDGKRTELKCVLRRIEGLDLKVGSLRSVIVAYHDRPTTRPTTRPVGGEDETDVDRRAIVVEVPLGDLMQREGDED